MSNSNSSVAIEQNDLLAAVLPCQVKYKGSNVELKSIDADTAVIRIKHAGYWHDYDKKVLLADLQPIAEHKHDIDSFNKCCQICGLYCG